jgi:hypothetical protein
MKEITVEHIELAFRLMDTFTMVQAVSELRGVRHDSPEELAAACAIFMESVGVNQEAGEAFLRRWDERIPPDRDVEVELAMSLGALFGFLIGLVAYREMVEEPE